jgi:hypothetical protein
MYGWFFDLLESSFFVFYMLDNKFSAPSIESIIS